MVPVHRTTKAGTAQPFCSSAVPLVRESLAKADMLLIVQWYRAV